MGPCGSETGREGEKPPTGGVQLPAKENREGREVRARSWAARGPGRGGRGVARRWARGWGFFFPLFFLSFPKLFQKGDSKSFLKIKQNTRYKIKYSSMYAEACL